MQDGNVSWTFACSTFSSSHLPFLPLFFAQNLPPTQKEEGKISRKGEFFIGPEDSFLKQYIVCTTLQYCTACSSSCCCCCFQPSSSACACVCSFSSLSFRVLGRALSLSPIFAASEVSLHILLRTQHTPASSQSDIRVQTGEIVFCFFLCLQKSSNLLCQQQSK